MPVKNPIITSYSSNSFEVTFAGGGPKPKESQQTLQLERVLGAVITVTVICAGLGLLIYLTKRKKQGIVCLFS